MLINQLRNFDVPLMVFLSGISYKMSGGLREDYHTYLLKRIVRLLIPTWIFLTIYLSLKVVLLNDYISWKELIEIFLLTDKDFGFIWIIRVFFLIAVMSPILTYITMSLSKYQFLLLSIMGFILTDLLSLISNDYLYKVIIMMIPYSLIFCIGIISTELTKKEIGTISILCILVFLTHATILYNANGHFVETQNYKEPPRTYYISYAIGISLLIYLLRNRIILLITQIKILQQCLFVGRHTIWIYFWHIPLLSIFRVIDNKMIYFIFVYITAIGLTYLQSTMVTLACNRIKNDSLNKNIKRIFNG